MTKHDIIRITLTLILRFETFVVVHIVVGNFRDAEIAALVSYSFLEIVSLQTQQVVPHYTQEGRGQIAPITGDHVGLKRAEIKQGVREIVLCKDGEGKMGLRVCSINKVLAAR